MRLRSICAGLMLVALAASAAGCTHQSTPAAGPSSTGPSGATGLGNVATDASPGSSPGTTAAGLGGTVFYLAIDNSTGATSLHALIGNNVRSLASFPNLAGLAVDVSPDGRQVAWVQDSGTPVLVVANVDGSGRHTVGPADSNPCVDPQWSPDSRRVLVTRAGQLGTVDIATGTFATLPKVDLCHPLWGRTKISYGDGGGQVFVANPDGTGARKIPNLGAGPAGGPRSFDFQSLSPDGTRIVLDLHTGDEPDGDVARGLAGNTVIDTRTGAKVNLPAFEQALFVPGGNLLTRKAGTLVLVSPDGRQLLRLVEPTTAKGWILFSYAPAG